MFYSEYLSGVEHKMAVGSDALRPFVRMVLPDCSVVEHKVREMILDEVFA